MGAAFAASMPTETLDAWGWRIPFLLGLVVGIAGYFLRRHVQETVPAERRQRAPIVETLHDHWRVVLGFAGLSVFNAVELLRQLRLSRELAADRRRYCARPRARDQFAQHGCCCCRSSIVTGLLTDRIGRKPFLLLATVLGFVAALPLWWLMHHPRCCSPNWDNSAWC